MLIFATCLVPSNSEEEGVAEVFEKFGLRYDVPMSYSQVGDVAQFPWIRPSDFLKSMVRSNDVHKLLGGFSMEESEKTLIVFWDRYRKQFPTHQIFADPVKSASLSQCLPLYVHGDKGTHYKRKGVLVLAFQSAIGHGSRHAPNERPEKVNDAGIPVNLLKTALQTRFLTAVCPKNALH